MIDRAGVRQWLLPVVAHREKGTRYRELVLRAPELAAGVRPGQFVNVRCAEGYDPLLRRPRHQGSFDATWSRERGNAFAQVLVRGETLDAEPAFGPTGGLYVNPGYTVANLGAAWKPVSRVEVFGRVLDLFDRQYEEVLGYPAMGRTAYMGARIAVGR